MLIYNMSISSLTSPQSVVGKDWANLYLKSISSTSANLNNGAITNVASINGHPVPPIAIDPNVANIIYQPGAVHPIYSNFVSTWAEVVLKINQVNINECLNVYIDDSIVSPVIIDQSVDCKGRVIFRSKTNNASALIQCKINDTVTLTNPAQFIGTLQVNCESLTAPNVVLSNGHILIVREGCTLTNTLSSVVPSIEINNGNTNVLSGGLGGIFATSTAGSLINVGIGSTFIFVVVLDSTGATYTSGTVSSTDGTATLFFISDSSYDASLVVNPTFTGTYVSQKIDKSMNVYYDDTLQLPVSGSSTVQGCLDYLKSQINDLSNGFLSGITLKNGNNDNLIEIGAGLNKTIGMYNAPPVVQATTASLSSVFVNNAGLNITDACTFDGYTLSQVVKALRDLGILA